VHAQCIRLCTVISLCALYRLFAQRSLSDLSFVRVLKSPSFLKSKQHRSLELVMKYVETEAAKPMQKKRRVAEARVAEARVAEPPAAKNEQAQRFAGMPLWMRMAGGRAPKANRILVKTKKA
jgi:hypothetical protein